MTDADTDYDEIEYIDDGEDTRESASEIKTEPTSEEVDHYEIEEHDIEDLIDEDDIKEEGLSVESTGEEEMNPSPSKPAAKKVDVYHCSTCDTHFSSVADHINKFHRNQSIYLDDDANAQDENEFFEEDDDDAEIDQLMSEEDKSGRNVRKSAGKNVDSLGEVIVGDDFKPYKCGSCSASFQFSKDLRTHEYSHKTFVFNKKEPKGENVTKKDSKAELAEQTKKPKVVEKPKQERVKKPKKVKTKRIESLEDRTCTVCNTAFPYISALRLHMRMHGPITNRTIEDVIPEGFKETMQNGPKFFCEICKKSYDQKLLAAHEALHKQKEDFVCKLCNKSLDNAISFEMHQKVHGDSIVSKPQTAIIEEGKFTYPCQYCPKVFKKPHEKVKHERIHTGEKPFSCEVCGKRFRVKYSLTLHLRTHTNLRPYVCGQCNKRYKSHPVYINHLQSHSDDRPYLCPYCPKTFKTSNQFNGHKKSHTKPYVCPECNRPFASMYGMKLHMKTHNPEEKSHSNLKHECELCGATYARLFALKLHMTDVHDTQLEESSAGRVSALQEQRSEADEGPELKVKVEKNRTAEDYNMMSEDQISAQNILQEEIIMDGSFQTEEVITDWMVK